MDSMEQRLRSLVTQGYSASISVDRDYVKDSREVRFTARLTLYGQNGTSQITVNDSSTSFDEAVGRAVATCEAHQRPVVLQAAE